MQDEGGAKAGQIAGFRVMLKYCEIKKAYCYYIKQIDSMLPCVWFSNRSQKTSKCGKNISDTLGYASCATYLFLPHFDVICDLLLNRRTATWNLFVNHIFWYKILLLCYFIGVDRIIDHNMAVQRYKISLFMLKNISLVYCAHPLNIFQHSTRNFISPHGHVISFIYFNFN